MSRKYLQLLILFYASFFLAFSAVGKAVKSSPEHIVTVKNQPNDDLSHINGGLPSGTILKNERSQDVFRIAGNKVIDAIAHRHAHVEKGCPTSYGHKLKRHLTHIYPSHNFW
jgi:hypothetical protein